MCNNSNSGIGKIYLHVARKLRTTSGNVKAGIGQIMGKKRKCKVLFCVNVDL